MPSRLVARPLCNGRGYVSASGGMPVTVRGQGTGVHTPFQGKRRRVSSQCGPTEMGVPVRWRCVPCWLPPAVAVARRPPDPHPRWDPILVSGAASSLSVSSGFVAPRSVGLAAVSTHRPRSLGLGGPSFRPAARDLATGGLRPCAATGRLVSATKPPVPPVDLGFPGSWPLLKRARKARSGVLPRSTSSGGGRTQHGSPPRPRQHATRRCWLSAAPFFFAGLFVVLQTCGIRPSGGGGLPGDPPFSGPGAGWTAVSDDCQKTTNRVGGREYNRKGIS